MKNLQFIGVVTILSLGFISCKDETLHQLELESDVHSFDSIIFINHLEPFNNYFPNNSKSEPLTDRYHLDIFKILHES